MFIGGVVSALLCWPRAIITSLWRLYITFFIVNFSLSAMTYVPINYIISRWFVDMKALVTSIVFTGSGLWRRALLRLGLWDITDMGWRVGVPRNRCHSFRHRAVCPCCFVQGPRGPRARALQEVGRLFENSAKGTRPGFQLGG